MAGHLLYKNTIAAAVAREVHRGGRDGCAYKAALERMGSDALKLCNDAARDAHLMNALTAARLNEACA
jgi:hypothetical protein